MENGNPILYRINGVPIRRRNKVFLQYNEKEYAKMVESAVAKGISVAEILRIMASPCDQCGNDKVTISLNAMSKKVQPSGRNIEHHHKKDSND